MSAVAILSFVSDTNTLDENESVCGKFFSYLDSFFNYNGDKPLCFPVLPWSC